MKFVNHTPFPALAFEGVDQNDQSFHVVVLRQTLTFATGKLEYADEQAPICDSDEPFGTLGESSFRQESDLFLHKPKCDVIVNATAYAPGGRPTPTVDVRLTVRQRSVDSEKLLIDKALRVVGESVYRKTAWKESAARWCIKLGTLKRVQPSPWVRSSPTAFTTLPLRYEYAYGGQCRVNAGDKRTSSIPPDQLLTPEQLAIHPDSSAPAEDRPVAHIMFESNPLGRGFAVDWALDSHGMQEVDAPRIEKVGQEVSGHHFWMWQSSSARSEAPGTQQSFVQIPAGFGVRSKADPARRILMGTIDDAFVQSNAPLPRDFDFAYFNAAPLDQQVPFLLGDETIELTNLCPPGTPELSIDESGDSISRLHLPKHECFGLIRLASGEIHTQPLAIDTVLIEPDDHALTLVWRLSLPKNQVAPIRALEMRLRTHEQRDRLNATVSELPRFSQRNVTQGTLETMGATK
jgi:hypothetical protein